MATTRPDYTIRLPEDSSYRHRFLLTDDAGDPIDLATGTITLQVYTQRTRVLTYTWTLADFLSVIGAEADGIVDLTLQPLDVAPGSYKLVFHFEAGADTWEANGPDLMVFRAEILP